jgi:hypothetical protein
VTQHALAVVAQLGQNAEPLQISAAHRLQPVDGLLRQRSDAKLSKCHVKKL